MPRAERAEGERQLGPHEALLSFSARLPRPGFSLTVTPETMSRDEARKWSERMLGWIKPLRAFEHSPQTLTLQGVAAILMRLDEIERKLDALSDDDHEVSNV